jgi:hypothetical protein
VRVACCGRAWCGRKGHDAWSCLACCEQCLDHC